tara:strand:+ start:446 stop:973 length:528 start_codon:yes stop_codon:yes gene_type:complete
MASQLKVDEINSVTTNGNLTIEPNGTGLIVPKRNLVFRVEATDTDQAITGGTNPVIQWETVSLDTGSYWDSTNHRYTPSVAGWYLFGGVVRGNFSNILSLMGLLFFKNGSHVIRSQFQLNTDQFSNGSYPFATTMIQMNGSGDYVDARIETDEDCSIHDNASVPSELWGMLVHGT